MVDYDEGKFRICNCLFVVMSYMLNLAIVIKHAGCLNREDSCHRCILQALYYNYVCISSYMENIVCYGANVDRAGTS